MVDEDLANCTPGGKHSLLTNNLARSPLQLHTLLHSIQPFFSCVLQTSVDMDGSRTIFDQNCRAPNHTAGVGKPSDLLNFSGRLQTISKPGLAFPPGACGQVWEGDSTRCSDVIFWLNTAGEQITLKLFTYG
jgi:hypothetical protein